MGSRQAAAQAQAEGPGKRSPRLTQINAHHLQAGSRGRNREAGRSAKAAAAARTCAQRHQQWRRERGRRRASHHLRWAWRPAHCACMPLACPWRPARGGAGPGQPAPRSGRLQGGAPQLQARRATIVQPRRRSGREAGGAHGGNPPHHPPCTRLLCLHHQPPIAPTSRRRPECRPSEGALLAAAAHPAAGDARTLLLEGLHVGRALKESKEWRRVGARRI